ncbi:hypothetical protein GN956_G12545 [Arapaima gigas]
MSAGSAVARAPTWWPYSLEQQQKGQSGGWRRKKRCAQLKAYQFVTRESGKTWSGRSHEHGQLHTAHTCSVQVL